MSQTPTPMEIARRMNADEGTGPALGIVPVEVREGYAVVTMTVTDMMLNGHGILHGGMTFTLADTAFAYACNSRNDAAVAQQASMTFLAPGQPGEKLTAIAQETALAKRTGSYLITVTGEDGRVIATMQGLSRLLGRPVIAPDEA